MRIAIIGAGNVGSALGQAWSRIGHTIIFGVHNPSSEKYRTASASAGEAHVTTVATAVHGADLIVLAVPWDAVPAVLGDCGNLDDRLILDATNPLRMGANGLELAIGFTTSGGEEVARMARGARVFKAMNQVGFSVMSDTRGYPVRPLMFVAGGDNGDNDDKQNILDLIESIGFDAIDAGPLRNARLLEPYAMLWIDQAMNHGGALDNAFGMLHKETRS